MAVIRIQIKRQDNEHADAYWETYELADQKGMTVAQVLSVVQRKAKNINNKAVAPLVWESYFSPLAPRCPLLINGRVSFPQTTLVSGLTQPLKVEPLSKFKVIRDLIVDRSIVDQDQLETYSWLSLDGFAAMDYPDLPSQQAELSLNLSACTDCGACLEACPQYGAGNAFRGPQILGQMHRLNEHKNGAALKSKRLHRLTTAGGVDDCVNAQNCEQACPVGIPLVHAIGQVKRQTTVSVIKRLFGAV